ncbi:hypothetical protein [Streptomyces sp. NPDC001770]
MDLHTLVKDHPLGQGGQGEVWAIKERKINNLWPIAYKEYSPASLREADFTALQKMVDFLPSLDRSTGRWLAEHSAWPAAIVEDSGRPRGFLMRQVPDAFLVELATAPGERRVAGFQFLLNEQQYIERIGITIGVRQRLLLLKDLADLLDRLHDLDVAVGDLSANNLLFSLSPRPACFFIDCDAMRLRGRSVLGQAETAGWNVPIGEPLATVQSDRYKFTLLVIRLFLGEQEGTDTTQVGLVAPELMNLAARGTSADAAVRPTMKEWGGALERAIARPRQDSPAVRKPNRPPRSPSSGQSPPPGRPRNPPPAQPTASGTGHMPQPGAGPWTAQPAPRRGNPAWKTITTVVLVVLALIAVAFLVEKAGSGHDGGSGSSSSDRAPETENDGESAAGDSESEAEEQASAVDELLRANAGTRGGVGDAVASVQRCESLSAAADVFQQAADARRDLLGRLESLNADGLTGGEEALADLRSAWSASAEADDAYQLWAENLSGGCLPDSTAEASEFQDAAVASERATSAKKAFVGVWNDIAAEYGLTSYAWDEV